MTSDRVVIGWREWLGLPDLGIEGIKAKIDTGARSSALHALHIESFEKGDRSFIRFQVHPYQRDSHRTITATAELLDWRRVKNSGGHSQLRPTIRTTVVLGQHRWRIDLTLTNRDVMGFRMLLGREALRKRFLVHPSESFLLGDRKTLE
jgi:hypothetical protein